MLSAARVLIAARYLWSSICVQRVLPERPARPGRGKALASCTNRALRGRGKGSGAVTVLSRARLQGAGPAVPEGPGSGRAGRWSRRAKLAAPLNSEDLEPRHAGRCMGRGQMGAALDRSQSRGGACSWSPEFP